MRVLLFFCFLSIGLNALQAQSMLTRRQVFDFDVSDEFHRHATGQAPPNAERIIITGKTFSANNDTVHYTYQFNNYASVAVMQPTPHLVYSYSVGIATITVFDLDTLMNAPYRGLPNDSCNSSTDSLFTSALLCGAQAYKHVTRTNACFEEIHDEFVFAKGLGQASHINYNYTAIPFVYYDNELFYYKKQNTVCGNPDTFALALPVVEYKADRLSLGIYPNPASNTLWIKNIKKPASLKLYNALAQLVLETNANVDAALNVSQLPPGVYTLVAEDSSAKGAYKIVVADE